MLVAVFRHRRVLVRRAVDRKVTLMARTLSDLTSQNLRSPTPSWTNIFAASTAS